MVAFSHCFRREAGAAGKQTGGLYRLHQFSKVEMFAICAPGDSDAMLQHLVDTQCELVSELGLHARVLMIPSEDLGASAYQKVRCIHASCVFFILGSCCGLCAPASHADTHPLCTHCTAV